MRHIIPKRFISQIHLLDVVFGIAIFIVIAIFLFLRFSRKDEYVQVRLFLSQGDSWDRSELPPYWYVADMKAGMKAYDSFGTPTAEIVGVSIFDAGAYWRRAFIDVKLQVTYDKNKDTYLFNHKPLQIGKPLDMTFGKQNVSGQVVAIGTSSLFTAEKKIDLKVRTISLTTAAEYKPGLEMKDSTGEWLARIEAVTAKPSRYTQYSDRLGSVIWVTNPEFVDLVITMRVKAFENAGTYYFVDKAALKIGEHIWLQFPQVSLKEAEIIKLY